MICPLWSEQVILGVDETQQYSAAEMERMMKVQDVLLKAMAKKITWWAAAEIIGVRDRMMRRWRERLEQDGYAGLADRRNGEANREMGPVGHCGEGAEIVQRDVLRPEHAALPRKAAGRSRHPVSYTWVQKALQGAGLVAKRHWRGPHRRRRPRRPLPGMLLHIDASKHPSLQSKTVRGTHPVCDIRPRSFSSETTEVLDYCNSSIAARALPCQNHAEAMDKA